MEITYESGLGSGLLRTAAAATNNTVPASCNYSNYPNDSNNLNDSNYINYFKDSSYTIPYQIYPNPLIVKGIDGVNSASNYQQGTEALKEENELLKTKVDLLEIQLKFVLNKLAEMEKLTEDKK